MAKHTVERLVVNQGALDDVIVELKSSDVAHGITDFAETDSYFTAQKQIAASGGAMLRGITEDVIGVKVQGLVTSDSSTRATNATGAVMISAHKKSGTGLAALGANTNILTVDSGDTVRFILDSDGDSHQDVGTAWTTFDVCNDVEILNVLTAFATRPNDPLRANFQQWLTVPENKDRLEVLGLAQFNDGPGGDGSIFVNMSKLSMLLVGAVRQMADRFTALESKVNQLLLPAVA